MTEDQLLRRAEAHVFLCGVDDAAEQLCRANMSHGIAKIHHAERALGLSPRAAFFGAPDATVTRNIRRWRQGFGYGGQVRWDPELTVLDSKPNGCGMLVGALERAPEERLVRQAARAAREAPQTLDGVELQYDLGESNHFVDGLELEQVLCHEDLAGELPKHAFIIHSSGHEHRPRSPLGPGLYFDESDELQRMATTMETPWGELHLLTGEDARAYHAFCAAVQAFNLRRRQLFGELLFGPHATICNATHQGMREPGVFHLGSYWFDRHEPALDQAPAGPGLAGPGLLPGSCQGLTRKGPTLYPLTLGPDQPVYLIRPRPNLSAETLERLGWDERIDELGLREAAEGLDMLPHGGGYSYPQLARLARVESDGGRRTFWLDPRGGGAQVRVEDARQLPFAYRDLEVLDRIVDLDLGTPVARYRISFVVKD